MDSKEYVFLIPINGDPAMFGAPMKGSEKFMQVDLLCGMIYIRLSRDFICSLK